MPLALVPLQGNGVRGVARAGIGGLARPAVGGVPRRELLGREVVDRDGDGDGVRRGAKLARFRQVLK